MGMHYWGQLEIIRVYTNHFTKESKNYLDHVLGNELETTLYKSIS